MSLALIDGDIVAFRAAAATQQQIDWGDEQEGFTINSTAARENSVSLVRSWMKRAKCTKALICLSPEDSLTFRHDLGPYKQGRQASEKPGAYWEAVRALAEHWPIKRIHKLEADDIMGILSTDPANKSSVVVTIDKDLKTVPCRLFNPIKDKKPHRVSQQYADWFWMLQTLTGDTVDGYPGCPGIGPVKAERLLEGSAAFQDMWPHVVDAFAAKELAEDAAILQARFARILRYGDFNEKEGLINLWHPNPRVKQTFPISPS